MNLFLIKRHGDGWVREERQWNPPGPDKNEKIISSKLSTGNKDFDKFKIQTVNYNCQSKKKKHPKTTPKI